MTVMVNVTADTVFIPPDSKNGKSGYFGMSPLLI